VSSELAKVQRGTQCHGDQTKWKIRIRISETKFFNSITICRDEVQNRTQYSYFLKRTYAAFSMEAIDKGKSKNKDRFPNTIRYTLTFNHKLFDRLNF
jgi:hypothetical protein